MGLKIVIHQRAKRDLEEIQQYLLRQADPLAADRVRAHLRKRIARLAAVPRMGKPSTHPDIRILPPTRFRYRIYYTLSAEAVVILHIRHTARRPPDLGGLA